MDKNTEQDIGRGAEVEARQAEDGTFELVVSDSAAHAAVTEEAAARSREPDRAPAPGSVGIPPERMKRMGLIALVLLFIGGGLIFAMSSSEEDEGDAGSDSARHASSDGFEPYGGGGASSAQAERSERQKSLDRLKATGAADDDDRADRRLDSVGARAQPVSVGRTDNQVDEEDDWELNEAELLEEARAVEEAERAAEKEREEAARQREELDDEFVDEEDYEDEEFEEEGELGEEEDERRNTEERREALRERGRRIVQPRLDRRQIKPLNRFNQAKPLSPRAPLRGMRRLQRQESIDDGQLGSGQGDEEEYWDEGEEQDRIPDFGRD